ncbi:MAG TPA: M10 family metallopeptidase C-terminal domain-containing protein [Stellaceae bacterium]
MSKPTLGQTGVIDHLTTSWGDGVTHQRRWYPEAGTVTYSIGLGATNFPPAGGENAGLVGMTATEGNSAAYAFSLWQELIPVALMRVNSSSADITLNLSSTANDGSSPAGHSSYTHPNLRTLAGQPDQILGEQIWIGTQFAEIFDPRTNKLITPTDDGYYYLSSYSILNLVHEIGHALGLSHPDTYDVSNGQKLSYTNNASYSGDFRQYSIMSYFGDYKVGTGWTSADDFNGKVGVDLYPQTPMRDDILAIQSLYGKNFATRSGDNHYGFHADFSLQNTVYDFIYNRTPILTIWDGGGFDTLDLSGSGAKQVINLNPGAYSSVMGLTNNLAIAYGCTIENAVAGSGNNTIIGNSAANLLVAGAGTDRFEGGGGNDTFEFTAAQLTPADIVIGGAGFDTLLMISRGTVLAGGVSGVETYSLANGGANSLSLVNANFTGVTGGLIRVFGGNSGNTIAASALSGAKSVAFIGGASNDVFRFSAASLLTADSVAGAGGNDRLVLTGAGTVRAGGVNGVETYVLFNGTANRLSLTNANFAGTAKNAITIYGGNGGNTIDARAVTSGKPLTVGGGSGKDVFFADGATTMTGRSGANQFVFSKIGHNTIIDFRASAANELVFISGHGFTLAGATATPKVLGSRFHQDSTGTFTSAAQRFVYNTANGQLFYSASGSNPDRHLVATLATHPVLNPSHLLFMT